MELRDQDKSKGNPNSFSYKNDDQDLFAKRSSREEDRKRESSSHEHQTHNQPRRDPDPPDPTRITSQPRPSSTSTITIRYRECQRNHTAHLGSHVVDGCGEFMPNGEEGTPEAMTCAACNCHRNFHRQEINGTGGGGDAGVGAVAIATPTSNRYMSFSKSNPIVPTGHTNMIYHPPPPPFQQAPPVHHRRMMAFRDGGGESSSEDLNVFRADGSSRKRFRTKFTQEQKEKMMEFAQKIEWRIQKQDDLEVRRFCEATGVKRQVFKVWMHNNKQAMKRKQSQI